MIGAAAEEIHPETVSQYKGDTCMAELDGRVDSGGRQAIDLNRNHSHRCNRLNRQYRYYSNCLLKK